MKENGIDSELDAAAGTLQRIVTEDETALLTRLTTNRRDTALCALTTYGQHMLSTSDRHFYGSISKQVGEDGLLTLSEIGLPPHVAISPQHREVRRLRMTLADPVFVDEAPEIMVVAELPTVPVRSQRTKFPLMGFLDDAHRFVVSMDAINRGTTDEKDHYRALRGLRWMAANMLVWNKNGIIMPERLDQNGTSLYGGK